MKSQPMKASEHYVLEKWIWTDADFEAMGWHDVRIHGMATLDELPRVELLMDMDYIFRWVNPRKGERYFEFWLAPATLAFENVFELMIKLSAYQPDLEIDGIRREERKTSTGSPTWLWTIDLHQGSISFWSTGFKLYIRKEPMLHKMPSFKFEERGGVSFDRHQPTT